MFLARDLSLKRHANTDFQILQPKLVAGAGTAPALHFGYEPKKISNASHPRQLKFISSCAYD